MDKFKKIELKFEEEIYDIKDFVINFAMTIENDLSIPENFHFNAKQNGFTGKYTIIIKPKEFNEKSKISSNESDFFNKSDKSFCIEVRRTLNSIPIDRLNIDENTFYIFYNLHTRKIKYLDPSFLEKNKNIKSWESKLSNEKEILKSKLTNLKDKCFSENPELNEIIETHNIIRTIIKFDKIDNENNFSKLYDKIKVFIDKNNKERQ